MEGETVELLISLTGQAVAVGSLLANREVEQIDLKFNDFN